MSKTSDISDLNLVTFLGLLGSLMGILILNYQEVGLFSLTLPIGFTALWLILPAISKAKLLFKRLSCWHALWLCMILSGLVFRVRSTDSANVSPLDPLALFRLGLIAVISLVLLYRLVFREPDWLRSLFFGLPAPLTGYSLICLLSAMWSFYPLWTLYKSTEYLVDIALITAIIGSVHTAREFKTFFDWTWILLGILIGSVWLGIVIWPELAIIRNVGILGFSIRGVFPAFETNGVGELGAILGAVAFTRLLWVTEGKIFYFLILLIALVTLVCAQSRSPLTGFLLALPVILFSSRRIGLLFLLPLLALALFAFLSAPDHLEGFFLRGQREEDFQSLSGRTNIWALGWEMFKERPLFGYGAYAGARFSGLADTMGTGNSSILNTWFEIVLGVGLAGGVLVLGAFLGLWTMLTGFAWSARRGTLVHWLSVEALGILTIVSVRSIFTVQIIWHPPVMFLLMLGFAEFIRRTYLRWPHENTFGA